MPEEPRLEYPDEENALSPMETWRVLFLVDAPNIESLKTACKEVGYVVVGAATIGEAWRFLDGKNHVDVIVCAAYLEEESVFDFLKGVRESPVHGKTMFVILSLQPGVAGARLDRSTARAGMALGADAYLVMPSFDACALVEQVKQLQPNVPMLQQSATEKEKRDAE